MVLSRVSQALSQELYNLQTRQLLSHRRRARDARRSLTVSERLTNHLLLPLIQACLSGDVLENAIITGRNSVLALQIKTPFG